MSQQESSNPQKFKNPAGNLLLGFIVIAVGFGLLLHKLDFVFFPHWVFSWKMLLIVIGLIIGAKQKFSAGPGWLIMILVGTFFLLDDITSYHWHLYQYGLPVGIIVIGLYILFRSVMKPANRGTDPWGRRNRGWENFENPSSGNPTEDQKKTTMNSGEDFLNITTLFGGIKKRVFSKNFRGGDISNFFGGTELDFTQADIKEGHEAFLDITQMFGGVKLIVPANWTIKSDMVAILGGYDDKRVNNPALSEDSMKVLRLDGTCILGGVEIKSY